MQIIEEQTFTQVTADDLRAKKASFENCTFNNCNLADGQLYELVFTSCQFIDCVFTGGNIQDTGLQNISFKNCQLAGVDFSKASKFLFEVHFEDCLLDKAIFYQKKNKGAKFSKCSLKGTDFTEANLSNAIFDHCDLNLATFDQTQLKGADFSTSYNYTIDPDLNFIKKAKFSIHGLAGLLTKYDIVVKG